MKALSLKQPWAELVLRGRKTIELRKWNTNFRGVFYVHASGNIDEEMMQKYGFNELPRQSIIGKVNLVDVKIYNNEEEFLKDSDKHLASSMEWGKYGFILENAEKVEPFECKGQLGFFDVGVSMSDRLIKATDYFEKDRKFNLKPAFEFFDVARQDYEVSKLLYENGYYSSSIFHLQQCIEKALKSYLLAFGIITESELKDINHKTPKGFLKLVNDQAIEKIFKLFTELMGSDQIKNLIEQYLENPSYWANLSYDEIIAICSLGKGYTQVVDDMKVLDKQNLSKVENHLKNKYKKDIKLVDQKESIQNFGYSTGKLLMLSFITFVHWNSTKYPDEAIKPSNYNKDFPIVKAFNDIAKETESVLNSLSEMYDYLKNNNSKV